MPNLNISKDVTNLVNESCILYMYKYLLDQTYSQTSLDIMNLFTTGDIQNNVSDNNTVI